MSNQAVDTNKHQTNDKDKNNFFVSKSITIKFEEFQSIQYQDVTVYARIMIKSIVLPTQMTSLLSFVSFMVLYGPVSPQRISQYQVGPMEASVAFACLSRKASAPCGLASSLAQGTPEDLPRAFEVQGGRVGTPRRPARSHPVVLGVTAACPTLPLILGAMHSWLSSL